MCSPFHPNVREAFNFSPNRGRGHRRPWNADGETDGSGSELEQIKGAIANEDSIRNRAQDFWHLVGWAFNCSVRYPKRWRYWKVWLEYMLDLFDRDWAERELRDQETGSPKPTPDKYREDDPRMITKSLLVRCLLKVRGRSSATRRVVRAAFANGEPEDLRAYPEIFEGETKGPKAPTAQKRKREGGDQSIIGWKSARSETVNEVISPSESSDLGSESSRVESDDISTNSINSGCVEVLGGAESICLRQRVLTLVSQFVYKSQTILLTA